MFATAAVLLDGYFQMTPKLETRVEALEHEVQRLSKAMDRTEGARDWLQTLGFSGNDPLFEDMIRLGREIREQERRAADAGSGH